MVAGWSFLMMEQCYFEVVLFSEAERKDRQKRSDLERFVESNSVKSKTVSAIKPKAKKPKKELPADEPLEESVLVSSVEDHSSFSQNAIALNLAGSAPTTRRSECTRKKY